MAEPTRHEQETVADDIAAAPVPAAAPEEAASRSAAVQRLDIDDDKAAADKKTVIKIDFADVNLLVDTCGLTKPRATELLRAHSGHLKDALRAWVGLDA